MQLFMTNLGWERAKVAFEVQLLNYIEQYYQVRDAGELL